MDVNEQNLLHLSQLFLRALNPATLKEAEASLKEAEKQSNFLPLLLRLIGTDNGDMAVRLSGLLYFKNLVFRVWHKEGEDNCINENDRQIVRSSIIELLVVLPENLQVQLSEAISLIADSDYPYKWPTLVQELISKINPNNLIATIAVLRTCHFVFRRWRTESITNDLSEEVQQTVEIFTNPYFELLVSLRDLVKNASDSQTLKLLFQNINFMAKLFLSICHHDIPQKFVDEEETVMGTFHFFLTYQNPLLQNNDEDEAGILEKTRTTICDICHLFYQKYGSEFSQVNVFSMTVFELLINIGSETKYDELVCQAMRFIGIVILRQGSEAPFATKEILSTLCERVLIPNGVLRESDLELFEDDPIEYIRRELDGSQSGSRRQATSELIRSFLSRIEAELVTVFLEHCERFLKSYSANPVNNWRDKDTAIFLFTAIAIKAQTEQLGATKTSSFVNISQFFNEHILADLAPSPNRHLILNVDSIKFIYNFRHHLSPEQLYSVLPPLVELLTSSNYVVYTFAAICIEGILRHKADNKLIFTEAVLGPQFQALLSNLFQLSERPGTPEKVAENDFIMKTVMRAIIIGRETISQHKALVSQKLGLLLRIVSNNPSNPRYNHYLFECIGAVVRNAQPTVAEFNEYFWPSFQHILNENIEEFVPYVLQILNQMLLFQNPAEPLPQFYQNFFQPLVQPALWEFRGNTPALVNILKSYISHGTAYVSQEANLRPIFGVYSNLINSKLNDHLGFEILEAIFQYIPNQFLEPFAQTALLFILKRLKAAPTNKFLNGTIKFISTTLLIEKQSFAPDYILQVFNRIDSGVVLKLTAEYIVPNLKKAITPADRALVGVGMSLFLRHTLVFLDSEAGSVWMSLLDQLVLFLSLPQIVINGNTDLDSFDIEDNHFSANFVKLVTSTLENPNLALKHGPPEIFLARTIKEIDPLVSGRIQSSMHLLSPESQMALQKFFELS